MSYQIFINSEQSAFVKNCYIGESIRQILDVLHYTNDTHQEAIMFAADFEAAFDSLDHTFMLVVLKKFGFNENFIKWISLLHNKPESCILNNGFSTGYFQLYRGTRQGDPLAPYGTHLLRIFLF